MLLVFAPVIFADTHSALTNFAETTLKELSHNPTWHKLIHYEPDMFSPSGYKSAIKTETFFLSSTGSTSSYSELIATLNSFYLNSETPDTHPQCKFRGRFFWLKNQLNFTSDDFPFIECPEYNKWSLNNSVSSLSIIMATGYLGNPASYYGHLLLKMNSSQDKNRTKLEDTSINYGAIVLDNENPLVYIIKGLFGGYDSGFSHIEFYFHNHNYGENEMRDLWEYELDLTQTEVQLIIGHTWEIMQNKYTYYFLEKNCAYRMAELIELADNITLRPNNPMWIMPQNIIQNLNTQSRNEKPLISAVKYHPSRQSRLYKLYSSLTEEQVEILSNIINNTDLVETSKFSNLPVSEQHLILDTLLNYYQYIRDRDALENDVNNIKYRKVLAKRYQLPPGDLDIDFTSKNTPHKGRKPSRISIGYANNEIFDSGIILNLRPAYYDSLDTDYGHVKNAHLSMASTSFSYFNDKLRLRYFDIVKIEQMNGYATGLPDDSNDAWKLKLTIEEQNLSCTNCLVARLQGDIGQTHKFSDSVISGLYAGGSIHSNRNNEGNLFTRLSLFTNIEATPDIRLRIEAESRKYIDSTLNTESVTSIQTRFRISQNLDLRLEYRKNQADELILSTGFYW